MFKSLLKISPYVAAIISGLAFFSYSITLNNDDYKSLGINIAASLLAIPTVFFFYEITTNLSKKKLKEEIFDYAKMQIDKTLLSVINHLISLLYPIETKKSLGLINKTLNLKEKDIHELLNKTRFLGFQIHRKLDIQKMELSALLSNSYFLKYLEDDQIIQLIKILKDLSGINRMLKAVNLYKNTGKSQNQYVTVSGQQLNEDNTRYPDRWLLLKDIGSKQYQVISFGDFDKFNTTDLTQEFVINTQLKESFVNNLYSLINGISYWSKITGSEFILDQEVFRLGEYWTEEYVKN